MARYTGPTCKLARREGTDLFLKSGVKPLENKCKFTVPPGGTVNLHLFSSGFTPLFRNRSVPSRRASLHVGPVYRAIVSSLNPASLRRPATVVRDRRHVGDAGDLQTAVVERAHRGLASRPRSADAHLDVLHAVLLRGDTGLLRRHLRGERCALARAAKAAAARGRPRVRIPLPVGDGDDGVVEGPVHVRDRIEHVLAGLLRLLGRL